MLKLKKLLNLKTEEKMKLANCACLKISNPKPNSKIEVIFGKFPDKDAYQYLKMVKMLILTNKRDYIINKKL